jgi:GT2 family glycosyltransferase
MPVHHGAQHLAATLESVAAEVARQAEPSGVELLLYNSGLDGGAARAVADRFAGRLELMWRDLPEMTAWTAKTNVGVAEARASHVVMLHQDDLWLPGHLAALRDAISVAPDAVMAIAPSRFVGAQGQALGPWHLPFAGGLHDGRDFARTLLVQNSIAIPSPVIARAAWQASGGLDEALWYTADWDLYIKLGRLGDVLVRPTATTAFRVHGGSLTMTGSRDAAAFRRQHEMVLERHLPALSPLPRGIEARARASIAVNCALAEAANGHPRALAKAFWQLATLGPAGAARFLKEARLVDRLRPRVTQRLAGALGT